MTYYTYRYRHPDLTFTDTYLLQTAQSASVKIALSTLAKSLKRCGKFSTRSVTSFNKGAGTTFRLGGGAHHNRYQPRIPQIQFSHRF